MKKFFLFFAALVAFSVSAGVATAQQQSEKEPHIQGFITNKFWDNWEIQGGVGPTFTVKTGSGIADANHWALLWRVVSLTTSVQQQIAM